MADCVICEEDAGKDKDVCINCTKKLNIVIIGNREWWYYLNRIIMIGTRFDIIYIQANFTKIQDFDMKIRPPLELWGLEEIRRYKVKATLRDGTVHDVILVKMELIPALRGLKIDKKRGLF